MILYTLESQWNQGENQEDQGWEEGKEGRNSIEAEGCKEQRAKGCPTQGS